MSITSSNTNRNCTKLRIVFLGDQGVGKSSIIDRYTTNRFQESHNSTVGIDFNIRDISRNGQVYRLQIWDTAGQERYRSLIPTYLKNAHAAIFVYDVTRQTSLQNIAMWHKLFKQHQHAPAVLVGNKIDLTAARKISKQEGQQSANKCQMKHFQVSAKSGKKINELFEQILDTILENLRNQQQLGDTTTQKANNLRTIDQTTQQQKRQKNKKKIELKNPKNQIDKKTSCCSNS